MNSIIKCENGSEFFYEFQEIINMLIEYGRIKNQLVPT